MCEALDAVVQSRADRLRTPVPGHVSVDLGDDGLHEQIVDVLYLRT